MAPTDKTENEAATPVATPVATHCRHCQKPLDKPKKGKLFCSPSCRFAQWDKDHPRVVPWRRG